jgi:hypothetical protein
VHFLKVNAGRTDRQNDAGFLAQRALGAPLCALPSRPTRDKMFLTGNQGASPCSFNQFLKS